MPPALGDFRDGMDAADRTIATGFNSAGATGVGEGLAGQHRAGGQLPGVIGEVQVAGPQEDPAAQNVHATISASR